MKTQISVPVRNRISLLQGIKNVAVSSLTVTTHLFSSVLKIELTNRETLKIIHSYVSFFCLIFSPVFDSPIVAIIMLVWFATTIYAVRSINQRLDEDDND